MAGNSFNPTLLGQAGKYSGGSDYVNSNGWYDAGSLKANRPTGDSDHVEEPWDMDQWGQLHTDYLRSLGFNGDPFYKPAMAQKTSGDADPEQVDPTDQRKGYSDEMLKWMADNGLTSRISQGEGGTQQAFFKGNRQYGAGTRYGQGDDAFIAAASILSAVAGGYAAAGMAAGAGAGAAGVAAAQGAGAGAASAAAKSSGDLKQTLTGAVVGGIGGMASGFSPTNSLGMGDTFGSIGTRVADGAIRGGLQAGVSGGNVGRGLLGGAVNSGVGAVNPGGFLTDNAALQQGINNAVSAGVQGRNPTGAMAGGLINAAGGLFGNTSSSLVAGNALDSGEAGFFAPDGPGSQNDTNGGTMSDEYSSPYFSGDGNDYQPLVLAGNTDLSAGTNTGGVDYSNLYGGNNAFDFSGGDVNAGGVSWGNIGSWLTKTLGGGGGSGGSAGSGILGSLFGGAGGGAMGLIGSGFASAQAAQIAKANREFQAEEAQKIRDYDKRTRDEKLARQTPVGLLGPSFSVVNPTKASQ